MKILTTSIIPAIVISVAMLGTARASNIAPAVQSYTYSNNHVDVGSSELIGSSTDRTAYGLLFTGTELVPSNENTVTNYGTIVSGTGYGGFGNAGILFSGMNNGQSNGNTVTNYGAIIGLSPFDDSETYTAGIGFLCSNNGDTSNNLVLNYGSIQVSGSGTLAGVGFVSEVAVSANNNTVINYGTISAASTAQVAYGVGFDGEYEGDSSYNTVINKGVITVSAPQEAYGIAFAGWEGNVNNNTVVNNGAIIVSGSNEVKGIYFNGGSGGSASNNSVTNWGSIVATSGSVGMASGIEFNGSSSGTANNNTITNWGTISVSPGGTAIAITAGNNNTITLAGHSSVNGLIAASGSNNVLNIAFTGVSAKAAAGLRTQLGTALSGTASSGTFTVRGVTYTYDPLIVNLNVSSYKAQAKTSNQAAIGANLDSFKVNPTGDMLALLNALDQSGNVARGLEQLSPQRYQIYGDIALANADFVTQGIDQRLNNLRSGSESFDTSGLGVASSSIQSQLGMSDHKQPASLASMSKDGKSVQVGDAPESKRWGAFLSGEVTFADENGRDWQQDSNFVSSGLLAGVDAKLSDAFTSGLLLSYAHTSVDLDSQSSNADVDTYGTGLYTGYHEGNFYGNGLATYSRSIYESDRNIDIPSISRGANGRTVGNQYMVNLDGGYDQPVAKDLTVGPFAGLQYVHLDVNSFTESGAGAANLAINDQSVDSLRSRLGVRLELRKELNKHWTVASEVRLGWQHEFANNDRAIVARFSDSGLGSFAVRTTDPERDAALLGLGLNATYRETLTAFADYDVEAAQRYTEQIVKGGFKWSF